MWQLQSESQQSSTPESGARGGATRGWPVRIGVLGAVALAGIGVGLWIVGLQGDEREGVRSDGDLHRGPDADRGSVSLLQTDPGCARAGSGPLQECSQLPTPDGDSGESVVRRLIADSALHALPALQALKDDQGLHSEPALRVLLSAIHHGTPEQRVASARALGLWRGSDPRVADALAAALEDSSNEVQLAVCASLMQRGSESARVVQVLVNLVESRSGSLRERGAQVLATTSAHRSLAVPAIRLVLRDPEGGSLGALINSLRAWGQDAAPLAGDVIDAWCGEGSRRRCVECLQLLVELMPEGTEALALRAESASGVGSAIALYALAWGDGSGKWCALAQDLCRRGDVPVRAAAELTLAACAEQGEYNWTSVYEAVGTMESRYIDVVAMGLRGVTQCTARVLPCLLALLDFNVGGIDGELVRLLGAPAGCDLSAVDWHARWSTAGPLARRTILSIVGRRSGQDTHETWLLDNVLRGLADESPTIRVAALRAVGSNDAFVTQCETYIILAARDAAVEVRAAAVEALGPRCGSSLAARATVESALSDESDEVRLAARRSLGGK
jgi:hypothetical protein